MANSPFQTSGNAPEIAPVQLRGGFAPAPGVLDAVADVAKVVVPEIRQNLEDSITDEVSGKTKSLRLALQATRFPSIQESIFSEEALANPTTRQALAEFTKIQDAVAQGRLPSTFALERLEVIQNQAIKDAPEFESEIRGAMRDATGQDPSKALFSRLLSESPANKTPQQKAFEQLEVDAIKNGVTVDDMVAFNNSAMQAAVLNNKFDLAKKQGTYDAALMGGDVRNRAGLIMTDVLSDARQLIVSGQPLTADTVQQLKNRLSASVVAATGQLISQTKDLPIDGSVVNSQLQPLKDLQANLEGMLEDGSLELLVSSRNKVTTELIKEGVLTTPDLAGAWALGGSQSFVELLDFLERSNDSAIGKALTGALSTRAQGAFQLQSIGSDVVRQYNQLGNLTQLETVKDKLARVIAGAVVIGTKGADQEFQITALNDMRKHGGDELTWSAFASNKVLTATAASNKLKAAFINMQVSTTAGLSQDLLQLAPVPDVDLSRLVLQENGELTVIQRPQVERIQQSSISTAADTALSEFAVRFNRANRISAKYSGAGVLPTSRYTNSQDYWNIVREEAVNVVQPKEEEDEKVIKFIRDADGNLVLSDEGE